MYLRQSTASQEVLIGRFVDSTDGNTEETALTIANTDIKLWKEGGTTLASKNSGGATHIANGMYYCVLDATDTDTIGKLEINVHVAGALSVRREFSVLSAAVYDSLFGTSALTTAANLPTNFSSFSIDGSGRVDVIKVAGTTQTARDLGANLDVAVSTRSTYAGADTAGTTTLLTRLPSAISLSGGAVTVGTNNDKTGYALTAGEHTAIAGDVLSATASSYNTAGTIGNKINSAGSASDPWSTTLPGSYISGQAGYIIGNTLDAAVSTRLASVGYTAPDNSAITAIKAKTDNLPSDPADASDISASFVTVNSTLSTIAGYLDTEVAAIKAKTDNLPSDPAAVSDIPTANQNADALLDRAAGVETNRTLRQALRLMLAATVGKLSGAATSTVVIRDTNDSKDRITATVDADGNRTSVTVDAS